MAESLLINRKVRRKLIFIIREDVVVLAVLIEDILLEYRNWAAQHPLRANGMTSYGRKWTREESYTGVC